MQKKQSRLGHLIGPIRWPVYASISLLVYLLFQVISRQAHLKTGILASIMDLLTLMNLLFNVVSEFGVLTVLFGLCMFTLFIGLRMVLQPALGWKKY